MSQPVLISWLLFAAHVLIVLVAAVLISANRKPSAAIAWLLAIIFIPLLGICAFLLVGFGRLPLVVRWKQIGGNVSPPTTRSLESSAG